MSILWIKNAFVVIVAVVAIPFVLFLVDVIMAKMSIDNKGFVGSLILAVLFYAGAALLLDDFGNRAIQQLPDHYNTNLGVIQTLALSLVTLVVIYAAVAWLWPLFMRASGTDGLLSLYWEGTKHTLRHPAWVIILNFGFAAGFTLLITQTKSAPFAFAGWVAVVFSVSVIVSFFKNPEALKMSPGLWLATFGLLIVTTGVLWHMKAE